MLSTNQQINSSPFAGDGSGEPSLGLGDRKCATATEAAQHRQYLDDAGQLPEAMAEYLDRIIEGEDESLRGRNKMSSGRVIEVIPVPGENPEIFDWTNVKPAPNRGLPTSPEPEPEPEPKKQIGGGNCR